HELNQVSSTSGSRSSWSPPHFGHVVGSSRETMTSPQLWQYQAGMRWPHQSWREMFQSRMFSSQSRYVLVKRSGTMRSWPYLSAPIAPVASGVILTNHCSEISGSMTVPQRWQWPSGIV